MLQQLRETNRLEDIKVANKPKTKMPVSERAKQFMPFAALKGLPEALQKMERIIVPKIELSEEMIAEIDYKIQQIRTGDIITITHFSEGEYLKTTGMVAKIDIEDQFIQIVDTIITFDNLANIEI